MRHLQLNTYDGKPGCRYDSRSAELVSVALALTTFSANGDQNKAATFSCVAISSCFENYTTNRNISGWCTTIQLQG